MIAASDVDFPEPVGPVTSTSPCGRFAKYSTAGGRPSSSNVGSFIGIMRSAHRERAHLEEAVATEAGDLLVGEREVDLAVGAQLELEVVGQHAQHDVLDVVLVEHGLVGDRDQLTVDPHQRRAERGDQQVAAARAPTATSR